MKIIHMKISELLRFAFIEHMVNWYGGVKARHLMEVFEVNRQSAQESLRRYEEQHPEALRYDASRKQKIMKDAFQPQHIHASPRLFLGAIRAGWLISQYRENQDWEEFRVEDVDSLTRIRLDEEVVRVLVQALLEQQVLQMTYQSASRRSARVVSPNQIAYADYRYHLRAFCHQRRRYMDFNLGRILSVVPITHDPETDQWIEWRSGKEDRDWHEIVEVCYQVNPRLAASERAALELDYELEADGTIRLQCRRALLPYLTYRYELTDARLGMPRWVKVERPPTPPSEARP